MSRTAIEELLPCLRCWLLWTSVAHQGHILGTGRRCVTIDTPDASVRSARAALLRIFSLALRPRPSGKMRMSKLSYVG